MEVLLVVGGIWLLVVIINAFKGEDRPPSTNSSSASHPRTVRKRQESQTFRPASQSRAKSNIKFRDSSASSSTTTDLAKLDLSGLHDAFTGAPLDRTLGLHQCQSCTVFYHTESLQVLREVNDSRCVSCQSTNIVALAGGKKAQGRDYTPNVVTLSDYKQHVGSVVTFEGRVVKVRESRRGNDFAVMFEDKSWTKGFKLVFFRTAISRVGGKRFISTLNGKTVKVRGLIVKHQTFGYEIIVSEKSMILSAK
ncbi:OB-fold nucleic acid binding domain-containing protein [Syntrophotalea acetylenivorans]|nr:OB-fold nucleic acid binding domain-containing protein [Syntrophotalea acetylenivorans]